MIDDSLTIFATPKAFERHIGQAQRNAIGSWKSVFPRARLILMGDDAGTAEASREFGALYIPQIARNEFNTPLLRSVFELAHKEAGGGLMLYVNADIILTSDLRQAIEALPAMEQFLLVGQRTDMYVRYAIDFGALDWEQVLRRRAAIKGKAAGPKAIDYFVFPHGLFASVPNFAIGRGWWDHWLLAEAQRRRASIIDATASVLAVHQNHDYHASEEALRNLALFGMGSKEISLHMAGQQIRGGRLQPRDRLEEGFRRRLRRWLHNRLMPE